MGITDGTFVCALCGEWQTGCLLCGTAPMHDNRESLRREAEAERTAEVELRQQERAIRAGHAALSASDQTMEK